MKHTKRTTLLSQENNNYYLSVADPEGAQQARAPLKFDQLLVSFSFSFVSECFKIILR